MGVISGAEVKAAFPQLAQFVDENASYRTAKPHKNIETAQGPCDGRPDACTLHALDTAEPGTDSFEDGKLQLSELSAGVALAGADHPVISTGVIKFMIDQMKAAPPAPVHEVSIDPAGMSFDWDIARPQSFDRSLATQPKIRDLAAVCGGSRHTTAKWAIYIKEKFNAGDAEGRISRDTLLAAKAAMGTPDGAGIPKNIVDTMLRGVDRHEQNFYRDQKVDGPMHVRLKYDLPPKSVDTHASEFQGVKLVAVQSRTGDAARDGFTVNHLISLRYGDMNAGNCGCPSDREPPKTLVPVDFKPNHNTSSKTYFFDNQDDARFHIMQKGEVVGEIKVSIPGKSHLKLPAFAKSSQRMHPSTSGFGDTNLPKGVYAIPDTDDEVWVLRADNVVRVPADGEPHHISVKQAEELVSLTDRVA